MSEKRKLRNGDRVRVIEPHDDKEHPGALKQDVETTILRIDEDENYPIVLDGDEEYFYHESMLELLGPEPIYLVDEKDRVVEGPAEDQTEEAERRFVAYHGIGSKNLIVADLDKLTENGYPSMVASITGDVNEQARFMHGFSVAMELSGVKYTIKVEYCV